MVQEGVSKHPVWIEILEKIKDKPYGTTITYPQLLEYANGIDVLNEKRYVIEQVKRELLRQHHKALENIRKKGYRIVEPNEHSRLCNREIKRAERRVRKGAEIILHVDYELLSDVEKSQANDAAARVQILAATLLGENKALKDVTANFRMPYLPRPTK